jgi:5-formyltetrahydrofolate cyclo-ligase
MPDNSLMSKESLRTRMREVRAGLSPERISVDSGKIADQLFSLAAFTRARVVGCYMALSHEVQTIEIVQQCRRAGKRVCVPARAEDGSYLMAWLNEGDETVAGPWRIVQPKELRPAAQREIDLMIVPGLAFDRRARRLGHGGGHYDRLLARSSAFKVGLAFEAQIVGEVPVEPRDVPMDFVVTEERIYPLAARAAGDVDAKR